MRIHCHLIAIVVIVMLPITVMVKAILAMFLIDAD